MAEPPKNNPSNFDNTAEKVIAEQEKKLRGNGGRDYLAHPTNPPIETPPATGLKGS